MIMNELADYFRANRTLSQAEVDRVTQERERSLPPHPVSERRTYSESR